MDIIEATHSYESWLADQIDVVAADEACPAGLERFVFFRATHYRWLGRVLEVAPEVDGPRVLCVGDLHLENFGTWRERRSACFGASTTSTRARSCPTPST